MCGFQLGVARLKVSVGGKLECGFHWGSARVSVSLRGDCRFQ